MLLVLCVDLDDDLGRKTGVDTPVIGRGDVEEAAVALATADPEDSDVNVLFEGLHIQDESVVPVIRSRVYIDGVQRVVVRQAQDLESMYYTIKQVLDDPETRGTILVPLGILLLIYPLAIIADRLGLPGAVFGFTSGLLGLYILGRGLGVERALDSTIDRLRSVFYAGRVTLITSVVAAALLLVGGVEGVQSLQDAQTDRGTLSALEVLAALVFGAVRWFATAGITSSLGRVTDEYLAGEFEWHYLNAPFYVVAISAVLYGMSAYFLDLVTLSFLAATLTGGTILGLVSTLAFAVVESRVRKGQPPA